MVASKRKVAWDKQAAYAFGKAIAYIRKDSDQSAEKVKRDILHKIDKLPEQPEAHALDKYKINNNGTYRVFELHRYRISYLIKENEIVIVTHPAHQSTSIRILMYQAKELCLYA